MAGEITRGKITRGDLANWDGRNATVSRPDSNGGTTTGYAIGNSVDILSVFGPLIGRTDATLSIALAHLGSAVCTISFAPGTWAIENSVTVPSNITCHIPAGVIFDVSSAKTLTFSGRTIVEYPEQWTSGAGTVSVSNMAAWHAITAAETAAGVTPTNYAYPPGDVRRYGAVGDGVTNDTSAVQAAILAASQNANTTKYAGTPVYFPAGIYLVTDGALTYGSSATGILFYGDGPTSSTIKLAASGTTQVYLYNNSGAQSYRNTYRDLRFLGESRDYCNAFRLNDSAGWEKKFWFQNCRFQDINYVLYTSGTTNADQCTFFNCEWYDINTLLYLNNVQTMLHNFYGCYGTFKKDLIVIGANGGGEVHYFGGDLIHIISDSTDHYWINGSAGPAVGTNSGQYTFQNVRSEHRGQYAKLVYWPVSDIANRGRNINITFDTCNLSVLNSGSGTTRSGAVVIGEGKTVEFRNCVLPVMATGTVDDWGYTITADDSGAPGVANPGTIKFLDCSVQLGLSDKITITNTYGIVHAEGNTANEGASDTLDRKAVNFSIGWTTATLGVLYARPKLAELKRRYWPHSDGAGGFTSEGTVTLPTGAVVLRAMIYKPAGGSDTDTCTYSIGTDDKATAYVTTSSGAQNAEHKALAHLNLAPLAANTTFRLYMTETTPDTCTQSTLTGGYAFIEYI